LQRARTAEKADAVVLNAGAGKDCTERKATKRMQRFSRGKG